MASVPVAVVKVTPSLAQLQLTDPPTGTVDPVVVPARAAPLDVGVIKIVPLPAAAG